MTQYSRNWQFSYLRPIIQKILQSSRNCPNGEIVTRSLAPGGIAIHILISWPVLWLDVRPERELGPGTYSGIFSCSRRTNALAIVPDEPPKNKWVGAVRYGWKNEQTLDSFDRCLKKESWTTCSFIFVTDKPTQFWCNIPSKQEIGTMYESGL